MAARMPRSRVRYKLQSPMDFILRNADEITSLFLSRSAHETRSHGPPWECSLRRSCVVLDPGPRVRS